jgi:hypothetical protein
LGSVRSHANLYVSSGSAGSASAACMMESATAAL